MNEKNLRNNLIELLEGGQAHVNLESGLNGLSPQNRNIRPEGMEHSIWEILEHMRLAQEDIIRYTLDAEWVSPEFPEGYWPKNPKKMTSEDWDNTISRFTADLNELISFIRDNEIDPTSEIPHGEGRTYLREILLVADHNAYHLGQIVQIRKTLGEHL